MAGGEQMVIDAPNMSPETPVFQINLGKWPQWRVSAPKKWANVVSLFQDQAIGSNTNRSLQRNVIDACLKVTHVQFRF